MVKFYEILCKSMANYIALNVAEILCLSHLWDKTRITGVISAVSMAPSSECLQVY